MWINAVLLNNDRSKSQVWNKMQNKSLDFFTLQKVLWKHLLTLDSSNHITIHHAVDVSDLYTCVEQARGTDLLMIERKTVLQSIKYKSVLPFKLSVTGKDKEISAYHHDERCILL